MSMRKLTKSERTRRKEKIVSFIILSMVCVIWLVPLLYMFGNAFRTGSDFTENPGQLFPSSWEDWTLQNFESLFIRDGKIDKMPLWLLNSLWSTVATVVLTLVMDLMTAYALVFVNFKGRNFMQSFLTYWMAVPGIIGTASQYTMYCQIKNMITSSSAAFDYMYLYFWMIVPALTGIFNLLLMRNFLKSIPKDIIESARCDGVNDGKIFWKIILPLARSTIMLIVLFTFTASWNNLMWPQMLMNGLSGEGQYWYTVTVGLIANTTVDNAENAMVQAMAAGVFAVLPILIVFTFTQNKMIEGVASTGVKG